MSLILPPFTAGPWKAEIGPYDVSVMAGPMRVAQIRGWGYLTGVGGLNLPATKAAEIQNANGLLIAAGPEMIHACLTVKEFLAGLETRELIPEMLYKIRKRVHAPLHAALDAAITKAGVKL